MSFPSLVLPKIKEANKVEGKVIDRFIRKDSQSDCLQMITKFQGNFNISPNK